MTSKFKERMEQAREGVTQHLQARGIKSEGDLIAVLENKLMTIPERSKTIDYVATRMAELSEYDATPAGTTTFDANFPYCSVELVYFKGQNSPIVRIVENFAGSLAKKYFRENCFVRNGYGLRTHYQGDENGLETISLERINVSEGSEYLRLLTLRSNHPLVKAQSFTNKGTRTSDNQHFDLLLRYVQKGLAYDDVSKNKEILQKLDDLHKGSKPVPAGTAERLVREIRDNS